MIPSKLDMLIYRGTTFEIELISQVKSYVYDPAIHNTPLDLKRSHAENLEFHGYQYEYVDFLSLYTTATLVVMKPWQQNSNEEREPLLELSLIDGDIELTNKSVKIGIDADKTQEIEFDKGSYKLLLVTGAGKVDGLTFGTVNVEGEK